ncbi:MAG: M20/M25/M40 family metallo-hydrolase, partial [Gammaproteobacteria bacterium]|nr:M20/M25/M40 family metallo-hydrolase [Gammaproteobacteria bacterium]
MVLNAVPTAAVDAEAQLLSNTRQLTFEGRRAGEGYFAPDGNALIFQSEREPGNPFFQIYHLDLTTGDTHRVSPGVGKTTCAFFRPGTNRVLFSSTHLDPQAESRQREEIAFRASGEQRRYDWDYDVHMDVFSADRDGSGLKRLTDAPGYDAEASYSPDGDKIVFTSLRNAYPPEDLTAEDRKRLENDPAYFGEIYIMDADGGNQTRLTETPGYDGGPFFSADGERIIWRRFGEDGMNADVYTMRVDGADVRRLTDFGSMSWAPYFHPSGAYAIFASNKHGFSNFELFLVDAAGEREPVRVTHTDGFDGLPVFSPDGESLSWTSNRTGSGGSQLFLADWDHAAAVTALASSPTRGATGSPPDNAESRLRASVEYLASDELEGRLTGSEGARLAAEYIAEALQSAGLEPFGDDGSYFQTFEFTADRRILPEANALRVETGDGFQTYQVDTDFRPLSFTANADVQGEVVFAGYGLAVPGATGYDSYAGLDVTDKIVLVLRYVPEGVAAERRAELNRYAGLRYKAMIARDRGAKAILVVAGPNSPNAGKLIPMTFDNSLAGSGILAASVSGAVAEALIAGVGKSLEETQSQLDIENPHFLGQFPLEGVDVAIRTGVERIKSTDRNVLARLPATEENAAETVVVGAHHDHIGRGGASSLAGKDEEGEIHNGADDNASGVAVALELTRSLALQEERRRNVLFAFWSGEELGLIGSSHFAEAPLLPIENIVAYLNFDMVGRLRDNKLSLQGVGSSSVWRGIIERRNVPAGFNLSLLDDPYLPTDSTAFYPKGIPILSFFTCSHEDYNRPTDDPDTLDYAGMRRIAAFGAAIVNDIVLNDQRPDYAEVQVTTSAGGNRDSLRAYLGTIPDYTTDLAGVKISGVRGGGPADKAGMQGGDVIVEFAGATVTNIYDYTYALDAIKIGEPVDVVVLRDGEKVTLRIVPAAGPEGRAWRSAAR